MLDFDGLLAGARVISAGARWACYRRRDLEDPFFSDRFPAISHQNFAKFQQNFSDFSEI